MSKTILKFLDIFVFLIPVEILSHYPHIDSSHWFREDVKLIIDKVCGEKLMCLIASALSSRTFLLIFWFLPVFVVFFIFIRLIVISY